MFLKSRKLAQSTKENLVLAPVKVQIECYCKNYLAKPRSHLSSPPLAQRDEHPGPAHNNTQTVC